MAALIHPRREWKRAQKKGLFYKEVLFGPSAFYANFITLSSPSSHMVHTIKALSTSSPVRDEANNNPWSKVFPAETGLAVIQGLGQPPSRRLSSVWAINTKIIAVWEGPQKDKKHEDFLNRDWKSSGWFASQSSPRMKCLLSNTVEVSKES